uniref:Uncharacterized protein n=1 Tax=viral metagenome TaxID=1070528 RepID=A0A6C0ICL0_9ZZZZ
MPEMMILKLNNVHPKFTITTDNEMTEVLCKNNLHGLVYGFRRTSETEANIDRFVFQDNIDTTERYISNFKDGWSFPIVCNIQLENGKHILHTMYLISVSQVPIEQMNQLYTKYIELEALYNECKQQLHALQQIPILGEDEIQKLIKEIERLRKWQTIACKYFPQDQTANIILLINDECK